MKFPRIAPYRCFSLSSSGVRTPLEAHGVVVQLAPGIEVQIDLAPHPAFEGQLCLVTPSFRNMKRRYGEGKVDDFAVMFGAANVLHVWVNRRNKRRSRRSRGRRR